MKFREIKTLTKPFRMEEINTDLVSITNNKHDLYKRNMKAQEYRNSVKKSKRKKDNKVVATLATLCILGYGSIIFDAFNLGDVTLAYAKEILQPKSETKIEFENRQENENEFSNLNYAGIAECKNEIQKYIVKYAEIVDEDLFGNTIIEDVLGNQFSVQDPPEIESGRMRVLFDSKGTLDVEDDVIIDITEAE